jgi:putative lipoprotein
MNNLIKTVGAFSALFLVLPFAESAQNPPAQDAAALVTGTATYRERIVMPKDAVFEATLEDVSKADAPAETIGKAVMENPGNPPYHFSISYDPRRIVDGHTYAVQATIRIGDQFWFRSDSTYPVITHGNGNEVSILLKSTQGVSGLAHKYAKLENTTWRLTRLGEKDVIENGLHEGPSITLQSAGQRVTGTGGCNRINGAYRLDRQTIHFGPMATTMMECSSGMDIEKDFLQALDQARTWKNFGHELEIYGEEGNLLAGFEADDSK